MTDAQIRYSLKRSAVLPVVSLIALGVSFITPQYSTTAYLAIPLIIAVFIKGKRPGGVLLQFLVIIKAYMI